jgi:hypothetical protein
MEGKNSRRSAAEINAQTSAWVVHAEKTACQRAAVRQKSGSNIPHAPAQLSS